MELLNTILIKQPRIKINSDGCFLYQFNEHGFTSNEFEKWMDNKLMDIWDVNVSSSRIKKCPWCNQQFSSLDSHIIKHKKQPDDLISYKLSAKAYSILLDYARNNHYDALAFFVNRKCHLCDRRYTKDRKFKCQIAESSRNKMRSFEELTFKCKGFNRTEYPSTSVAIIYRRRPVK